jgi:hypothetical protein
LLEDAVPYARRFQFSLFREVFMLALKPLDARQMLLREMCSSHLLTLRFDYFIFAFTRHITLNSHFQMLFSTATLRLRQIAGAITDIIAISYFAISFDDICTKMPPRCQPRPPYFNTGRHAIYYAEGQPDCASRRLRHHCIEASQLRPRRRQSLAASRCIAENTLTRCRSRHYSYT